jgi:CheY-like chemotaxis protein
MPATYQDILMADDDESVLDSLETFLGTDFTPVRAGGAKPRVDALRLWDRNPNLRLAVVDLMMRNEAGVDTVEEGFALIRTLKQRPGSYVAVHSGYSDPALQARAKELGADDYFPKDVDPEKLHNRLLHQAELQAEWLKSNPPPPEPIRIDPVADARHKANEQWFWSQQERWGRHENEVVAIHDRTVVAAGPDYLSAFMAANAKRAAASQPALTPDDYTFVTVWYVPPDAAPRAEHG